MGDVFATTRNGHLLVDSYDPETNTLDLRSNGLYPSNVLSFYAAMDSDLREWFAAVWRFPPIIHSSCEENPYKTILPKNEF